LDFDETYPLSREVLTSQERTRMIEECLLGERIA
jgi:hypothetical protein